MSVPYIPFSADRDNPFVTTLPLTCSPPSRISGPGSPEGLVDGAPGQHYSDTGNDDLYQKVAGNQKLGWVKVGKWTGSTGGGGGGGGGGGTGGSGNVVSSSVDPNYVLKVTGPAICIGYGSKQGSVWVKATSEDSDTDWVLLIN